MARKLLRLVSEDSAPIPEISKLIRSDAVFTGEVLRLSNSALIGLRYEVVSILHAVSVLGIERLKGIVLTVGMRDFLRGSRDNRALRIAWRHQLATALAAEWLAESCWFDRAVCYTAGLLHELGKLSLIFLQPAAYVRAQEMAARSGMQAAECERKLLDIDHIQAGDFVAAEWELPEALRAAVCLERLDPAAAFNEGSLAAVACLAADSLGFPLFGEGQPWNPTLIQECLPSDVWSRIEPKLGDLRESIPCKINFFECEFLS